MVDWDQADTQRMRDPVTGAYARGWFRQRLEEDVELAFRRNLELSLIVVDVDHFKSVNDAFGHARGDEVLREVVERAGHVTRKSDTLFRYGGDEFVLLLPGTSKEEGLVLAGRLLEEVRGKAFRGDPPLSLTLSMGLASLSEGIESGDELFMRADQRLLEAKRRGRSQVVWEDRKGVEPAEIEEAGELVERQDAIESAVEFVEGLGEKKRGVFIIIGGRKTGKTRFLEEVERLGAMRGYEVLQVRGDAAKKGRAYGVLAGVWREWGGPELSEVGEEGFEEEVGKLVEERGKEGLIVGVDEIGQVDRATLRMMAELLRGTKVRRVGVVYTTGPGEWQRAFPLEVALRGAVEMRGWTREGVRIWLRGQMKWEAEEGFVEWLYEETGGVPGYVREGVKYLIGRGVLEREGEGWGLRRDYQGVALGESLGVVGERGGHNLPVELTGFVGREREIEEVRRLLEEGRLVTVVGPGGTGKTRLGVQVGREGVGEYRDGVWFVGLAGLERGDQIATAVGEALNFTFYGGRDTGEQLQDYLREKETLLIFDNFEHVMEGAGIVQDILGAAPGVKVVATSRERLKLEGEAVLELGGMGYPEEEGGEEKAEEYTAVQLFVQSARRARTEFKLEKGERGNVARICRLVRGMPLGIELAAAWVTTYSCEDIAREIERNLDFVAAQQKDRPERHLSLRAVFEYSWQLLSARESDALVRLSVFRGGFRREAAEKAAGVTLLAIAALVDKSLIQRHATGRYEIHPVLRQYAEEKGAGRGDENAEIRGKHCEYFARFLSARLADIISARQQDVATEISEEIENVRSAWRWLIDHQRLADLDLALGCLAEFYEMRSWYHEGEEAFREAAQMLERLLSQDGAAKAPIELLYGKVLRRSGWFYFRLSKYDTAAEVLRTSLAILQKHDAKMEEGTCHYYLGAVEHLQGRYADAQRELETSLKLAEEVGNALGTGASLTGLGIICTSQGNWEQAYQFYQKSLQVSRTLGDVWGIANALNNLGWAAAALGQVTEARGLYRESLVLCKQLGNRYGMANCLNNLGYLASGQGEQGQAKRFYQESLVHFREIGDRSGVANVLANLGAAHLELAEEEEAERLYYQSLETALEVQALPVAIEAIVGIARLMIRRGNPERAIVLLGAAQAQEATDMQVKERAGRLLAELEAEIPAEAFAAALQRGSTSTMDSVIAEVLRASNRQGPESG